MCRRRTIKAEEPSTARVPQQIFEFGKERLLDYGLEFGEPPFDH